MWFCTRIIDRIRPTPNTRMPRANKRSEKNKVKTNEAEKNLRHFSHNRLTVDSHRLVDVHTITSTWTRTFSSFSFFSLSSFYCFNAITLILIGQSGWRIDFTRDLKVFAAFGCCSLSNYPIDIQRSKSILRR